MLSILPPALRLDPVPSSFPYCRSWNRGRVPQPRCRRLCSEFVSSLGLHQNALFILTCTISSDGGVHEGPGPYQEDAASSFASMASASSLCARSVICPLSAQTYYSAPALSLEGRYCVRTIPEERRIRTFAESAREGQLGEKKCRC